MASILGEVEMVLCSTLFAFRTAFYLTLIVGHITGFAAFLLPRSIDLLVEEAAKDRKEYVEARRMDMEVLDAESPHCSLWFVRILPMRTSYSSMERMASCWELM